MKFSRRLLAGSAVEISLIGIFRLAEKSWEVMLRPIVSASLCAALLTACTSSVPRLYRPDRVDVFCGDRATVATAIESIVASVGGDVSGGAATPSDAQIHKLVKTAGGVIAHWNNQPLYAPKLAKSLGVGR